MLPTIKYIHWITSDNNTLLDGFILWSANSKIDWFKFGKSSGSLPAVLRQDRHACNVHITQARENINLIYCHCSLIVSLAYLEILERQALLHRIETIAARQKRKSLLLRSPELGFHPDDDASSEIDYNVQSLNAPKCTLWNSDCAKSPLCSTVRLYGRVLQSWIHLPVCSSLKHNLSASFWPGRPVRLCLQLRRFPGHEWMSHRWRCHSTHA